MKYKAIIFDMDGTIIDTHHIWKRVTKETLKKRGIILDPEEEQDLHARLSGMQMREYCKFIKEITKSNEPLEAIAAEKTQRAHELYEQEVCFIDGFIQFHAKVIMHNLKVSIATNASSHTLAITDKALNLRQYFGEHMYTLCHVNNVGKPDPKIYLHAAEQLGIDPIECVAIEDSYHGLQAAHNAGMFVIGINTSKKPEILENAKFIIDHYDEIDLQRLLKIEKS